MHKHLFWKDEKKDVVEIVFIFFLTEKYSFEQLLCDSLYTIYLRQSKQYVYHQLAAKKIVETMNYVYL